MKFGLLFVLAFLWMASAHGVDKVSVQFHWMDQFEFAGFYVAKEKGFYQEEGLDVSFLPFYPGSTDVVDSIISGKAQYGVNYSSIIQSYHNDVPIVAIAALLQESPIALMALKTNSIKVATDLRGKKIMIGNDALSSAPIMALLFSHGLLQSEITSLEHSHDLQDLINGNVDALSIYSSNEPFIMDELGIDYQLIDTTKSHLSFYEDFLFTTQQEVNNNPERVEAFRNATLKGWRYAYENIDETAELIFSKYNTQNKSLDSLVFEGKTLKALAYDEATPFGSIDLKKLEKIEDAYRLMGIELSNRSIDEFVWNNDGSNRGFRLTDGEKTFIANNVIKAGTTTQWVPFSFVNKKSGEPAGISKDIWQKIVDKSEMVTTTRNFDNFGNELTSLKEKEIDVIYSAGITEDRKEYALFSEPYAQFPISIATSKDENFIQNIDELRGKPIAVGENFTAHKMMKAAYPFLDYITVPQALDGLQMVSKGEAFAFVDIMPSLVHAISQHGFTNIKISGNTSLNFDLRVMIRDDYPELVSIANKIISTITDEEKQAVLNRWINVQYDRSFNPYQYWQQISAFLVVLLLIFYWMYRSKRLAMSANRAKSEFLASMSHEIRTPMTGVIGFADLLLEDDLPKESQEKVLRIKQSTNSLLHLLNDILDMSKLEAGKMEIEDIDFNLKALISNVVGNFEKSRSKDKQVTFSIVYPLGSPENIKSDSKRVRQILVNIIGNALKFTSEGSITVTVAFEGDQNHPDLIKLSIEDTGIGMDRLTATRVFSKFTQADASISRKYDGSGLGLAICKRLVELLKGDIGVDSVKNQGSTFWFTLPFYPAGSDPVHETLSKTRYVQTLVPQKILLAEDNKVNQIIINKMLISAGHQVTIVENGIEAIESHEANDFDLILMDIRMPEMDGHDATKVIRQKSGEKAGIPVIAITADVMKDSIEEFTSAGINGYVHKPIDKDDLFLTMNTVMKKDIHQLDTRSTD